MARVGVPAGLVVAILVLGGCSSSVQRVDLGEWRQYLAKDPYTGDDVPRPGKVASPSPAAVTPAAPRAAVARDLIERAEREEAFARSEFRPWVRVDTKKQEQFRADEAAQERSLKGAMQSTCRSC
jgi:hypothetical protein